MLATLDGGLSSFDYAVIAAYLAAMLSMGLVIARRQKSIDDFFVGGRNLPSWAVGISLIASLLSTITYLGMPGEMFRTGIGFVTRQLGLPVVLLVVWFVIIPFFMKLNLTSAYEYLERRFDYPTRAIAAMFCLLLLFGWISVVVLTASKAMSEIALLDIGYFFGTNSAEHRDADMHAIILGIGMFSVLYTTLGGIRAVVWTDVIQFFVLISGALFTMGAIAYSTNSGIGDWLAVAREYKHEQVEWFSLDIRTRSTVFTIAIGMTFWTICTHGSNQVALQRYFAVKDVWAARRTFLVNALSSFGLGLILAGVGIALMYFIQTNDLPAKAGIDSAIDSVRNESQDKIFPQFIRLYLPSGLRGLVVAALFAAAMSTIDSGSNSVSTIITLDFFRRLRRGQPSKKAELRLARMLTASMGVIVVACTVFLYHISKGTDLITLCQKGFNCFLGPLGALFALAMFSKGSTGKTVIPALFVGEAVGVCSSYAPELFDAQFSTHLVIATAFLSTIVADLYFVLIFDQRASEEQQRWMWKPVVKSGEG